MTDRKLSNKNLLKIAIFLFPLLILAIFIIIKLRFAEVYRPLMWEDSYIEYAQFLFFFLSTFISLYISITFFRSGFKIMGCLYLFLAIGLLLISFEEISWGQRIFNIQTTDFFNQHNYQDEITLHNLFELRWFSIKLYQIVGLYGSFLWIFIPRRYKNNGKVYFLIPNWYLSLYFFPVLFRHIYFDLVGWIELYSWRLFSFMENISVWRQQEPSELILALGFLIFLTINFVRQRQVLGKGFALLDSSRLARQKISLTR